MLNQNPEQRAREIFDFHRSEILSQWGSEWLEQPQTLRARQQSVQQLEAALQALKVELMACLSPGTKGKRGRA